MSGEASRDDGRHATTTNAALPSDDQRRLLLKAAAYLLGYPDEGLGALLDEIRPDLEPMEGEAAASLVTAMTRLQAIPLATLVASYVASFDFSEARALYLTAHELGDSRRRGQALLDLLAMMRAAGFEPPDGELPDHLPTLLEFVSCAPSDMDVSALEQRLATVCAQIRDELAPEDPYQPVLAALCMLLPAAEPKEAPDAQVRTRAPRQRFPLHERADTVDLPYPLRYE
ncbi:MAG TPA: nitrate reductase molybdenum cofactor assembly chaperone [Ktedonobacterales bacterium]|nr:nitrate reductase molybdenum cofactor assembly chaperone [Ktedonobacterales bacterium]